jgi:hypothetical protein
LGGSFFELLGSGTNGAFLDGGPSATSLILNRLNSNVDGRYIFNARNGIIVPPTGRVPEPMTILGTLAAAGGGALLKRRSLRLKGKVLVKAS